MTDRTYQQEYENWARDPVEYWTKPAADLPWFSPWVTTLDKEAMPTPQWFAGGKINACYAALDTHIEAGRGDDPALIYESPVTGTSKKYSFVELRDAVAKFAGGLASLGVVAGDCVIIYMPMVPEAVIAMLACARIGAVHSVVFGGFSSSELASRIDHAKPNVMVSASCGFEPGRTIEYKPLLDGAIELAGHKPAHCVIYNRTQHPVALEPDRDHDFHALTSRSEPANCAVLSATDPLYILYTSGTTGAPKGIVRDIGGYLVALKWSMSAVYDASPGEVYWAASDIGWVVGHSYIVYAPLIHGCATVLYEGKPVGTPDAGAFWSLIEKHRVSTLFTAPTAIRAIRQADPDGAFIQSHDLSSLKTLFLAGERADPATIEWSKARLGIPVIDHWWQTELGWPAIATCAGLGDSDGKIGSAGKAVPGYAFDVLDEDGTRLSRGDEGALVIKAPLAPGCLTTLWHADDRYREAYLDPYPGYYLTGDAGYIDEDGFIFVMGRTDDVMNVAGHRLSTAAIEEVLSNHADVVECAVIARKDELKGQIPVGLVVLRHGVNREPEQIYSELVADVRSAIGPVAAFKEVLALSALPKTRSGKILRAVMRKIYDGEDYVTPPTIEDESVLTGFAEAVSGKS